MKETEIGIPAITFAHGAYFQLMLSINLMLLLFEKANKYAELRDDKIPISGTAR